MNILMAWAYQAWMHTCADQQTLYWHSSLQYFKAAHTGSYQSINTYNGNIYKYTLIYTLLHRFYWYNKDSFRWNKPMKNSDDISIRTLQTKRQCVVVASIQTQSITKTLRMLMSFCTIRFNNTYQVTRRLKIARFYSLWEIDPAPLWSGHLTCIHMNAQPFSQNDEPYFSPILILPLISPVREVFKIKPEAVTELVVNWNLCDDTENMYKRLTTGATIGLTSAGEKGNIN